MSSILAHGLAGVLVASPVVCASEEKKRRLLALGGILAIVPDLDILIYIAFGSIGINPHRGITHTLLFAFAAGAAFAGALGPYFSLTFRKGFVLFSGILCSHLALDYLMGCGPEVPFFWPLSEQGHLFPYRIVPTAYYGLSAKGLIYAVFNPLTVFGMLLEALIFVPPILLLNRKSTLPRWSLAGMSATTVIFSAWLYNQIP